MLSTFLTDKYFVHAEPLRKRRDLIYALNSFSEEVGLLEAIRRPNKNKLFALISSPNGGRSTSPVSRGSRGEKKCALHEIFVKTTGSS